MYLNAALDVRAFNCRTRSTRNAMYQHSIIAYLQPIEINKITVTLKD